jgi:hypothetical protein
MQFNSRLSVLYRFLSRRSLNGSFIQTESVPKHGVGASIAERLLCALKAEDDEPHAQRAMPFYPHIESATPICYSWRLPTLQ